MTTLFAIWGITGLMLVALFVYAWRRGEQLSLPRRDQSLPSLSHVVWQEVATTKDIVSRLMSGVRPHGLRLVGSSTYLVLEGRKFFMSRIYGRIKIEKGLTPSFFLKQIAEHRDERKQDFDRTV